MAQRGRSSGKTTTALLCAALGVVLLGGCTAMNRRLQFAKAPPAVSPQGFICPLYGVVSSSYGKRQIKGKQGVHEGIDVSGRLLVTPVYAAQEGVVCVAKKSKTLGLWIEIQHPDGWTTRYGHLSWLHANKGQNVKRGDLIGRIGNTGRSYGAHLHFEVLRNGKHVDPLAVVPLPKPQPKPPPKPAPKPKKPPPASKEQEKALPPPTSVPIS